jgi:hypothetical protein
VKSVGGLFVVVSVGLLLSWFAAASPSALQEMGEEIAVDVGQVLTVYEGDPQRVIFIFEERHDSILAQIEIAIMLNRAYALYGLRYIGLEGLAETEGPLDLSWIHRPPPYRPDQPITGREDVIAHTLFQGEVGAGEMMGLIYDDAVVAGIDDATLYAVATDNEIWSAPFNYLYNIAVAEMSTREYDQWKKLFDQKKYAEAEQYAIGTSSLTQEFYDRLTDEINAPSAEEMLEIYSVLRSRARRANINLPSGTQQALQSCMDYLEVVSRRSDAMAGSALSLASTHRGTPVAINVGFMHTERIVELLEDAGVSFLVFRSQSHASGTTAGLLSQEALERKAFGLSVGTEGHIGALLDGRKKPEVTCTKWWYGTEQALAEVMQLLLEACRWNAEDEEAWSQFDLEQAIASGDIQINGSPVSEFLLPFRVVSFEAAGNSLIQNPDGGIDSICVDVVVIVENPDTGEKTELLGKAELSPETDSKGQVTLEELLGREREVLLGPGEPSTVAEETEAVQTCSNTTIIWQGA